MTDAGDAPRVPDWRDNHDPADCHDCIDGNPHPIDIDTDGSVVYCNGTEAWNTGEPPDESEWAELDREPDDGKTLIAGVLYDNETLEEADPQ